ncbi:MAG: hypothetical protein N4A62_17125 [Marinisporobacter sp.]|nr:hypothetical protein [Marinisporobacter sp.]
MVQTDLFGNEINRFSIESTNARVIDLSFDSITSAPICVLWSNEKPSSGSSNYIRAWEIRYPQPTYRGVPLT